MPWYIFAAITPIFYSVGIFIDKFLVDKQIKNPLVLTAITGTISGIIGVTIGLIVGFKFMGFSQIALILLAGILLNWYLIPYYAAIQRDDASRVIPLYQFIPIFTLTISTIFFKETLTIKQIVGMGLIIVAGILISVDKFDLRFLKPRPSFWFMMASCLMYGSVGLLFRFVSKSASYWSIFSIEYIGAGLGGLALFILPSVRKDFGKDSKVLRSASGLLFVDKSFSVMAQMAEGYAVTLVAVPLVNIVNGIQPAIILLMGLFLTRFFPHIIKENIKKEVLFQKILSIVIILVGLYLVYL